MTKRVIAGLVILAVLVSFAVYSESYLRRTVQSLSEKAEQGEVEAFQEEFSRNQLFLQILLDDASVGELDLAGRKMAESDNEAAEEGRKQAAEVLYRIGEENFFSLVKLF